MQKEQNRFANFSHGVFLIAIVGLILLLFLPDKDSLSVVLIIITFLVSFWKSFGESAASGAMGLTTSP